MRLEAVRVDPARMSGVPCFRGTRLPVQQLFDWIEDGVPLDEFPRDFQVDRRAATAVLRAGASPVRTAASRHPNCAARSRHPRAKVLLDVGVSPRLRQLPKHQLGGATIAIVAIDDTSLGGLLAAAPSRAKAVRSTLPGESRLVPVAHMRRLTRDHPQ